MLRPFGAFIRPVHRATGTYRPDLGGQRYLRPVAAFDTRSCCQGRHQMHEAVGHQITKLIILKATLK